MSGSLESYSLRLNPAVVERIDLAATKTGIDRSRLVRLMLNDSIRRLEAGEELVAENRVSLKTEEDSNDGE